VYGGGGFRADRQLHSPTRQRLRQEEARPILEQLQSYLREQQPAALPKSPLGAAIGYALRNWVALTRYAENGSSRSTTTGHSRRYDRSCSAKDWPFAGSEAAAHRTAILCSLMQTCRQGVALDRNASRRLPGPACAPVRFD
jgi:hypothetical protein